MPTIEKNTSQIKSKKELVFITSVTLVFGGASVAFSLLGLILPERQILESPILTYSQP